MRKNSFLMAAMLLIAAACRFSGESGVFVIDTVKEVEGLHAPWDGLDDDTVFHCFTDDGNFCFMYEVRDSTITVAGDFNGEPDVELEDRVEIFFSARKNMDIYYCAEIDPLGRVLDYSCRYYRDMDYKWNFRTLKLWGALTGEGYAVGGKIAKEELEGLGIDMRKGFFMGVFRADFRSDGSVNWYSLVETGDESPDFHKPDVLFKTRMR